MSNVKEHIADFLKANITYNIEDINCNVGLSDDGIISVNYTATCNPEVTLMDIEFEIEKSLNKNEPS